MSWLCCLSLLRLLTQIIRLRVWFSVWLVLLLVRALLLVEISVGLLLRLMALVFTLSLLGLLILAVSLMRIQTPTSCARASKPQPTSASV